MRKGPRRHFDGNISNPKGFLPACLLLLLAERQGHGYEITDRLRSFGFDQGDPSKVYNELRLLEDARLLDSEFDEPLRGPAHRVYRLTPEGRTTLEQCRRQVEALCQRMETYLDRCRA